MEDRLYGRVICIYTPQYFVLNVGSIEQIRLNETLINVIDDSCQKFTRPHRCEDDYNLEGSIVFAFNSLFKKWGRAFVVSPKKGILKCNMRLTALYLDFGNSATISLKDIIPFTSIMGSLTNDVLLKILTDPLHIVPVTLPNIEPVSAKFWSQDAIEKFAKIVRSTIFDVLLLECSSFGPAKVNLIPTTLSPKNSIVNESNSTNQNIKQTTLSELLIDLNLAQYKEDNCIGVSNIIECNQNTRTDTFTSQHLSRYKPIPIIQENERNQMALSPSPKSAENKCELDQCAMSQNVAPICPVVESFVFDKINTVEMANLKISAPQLVKNLDHFCGPKKGKIIKYDRETLMRLRENGAGLLDWGIINELDDFALDNPMIGPIFIRSPKAKAARMKALEKCNNLTPIKPKAKNSEEPVVKYGATELKALRHVTSSSQDVVSVRVRQNLAKFSLQNLACIKAVNDLNPSANHKQILQNPVKEEASRFNQKVKADHLRHRTTSMQLPEKEGASYQCPVDRKSFSSGVNKSIDFRTNKTSGPNGNVKKKDSNPKCIEAKKENGNKARRDKGTPVKKSQNENKSKSIKKSQVLTRSSENLLTMVGCDRDQAEGLDPNSRSESKKPALNRVGGTGWNFLKSFSRLLGNSDASAHPNILSSSSSSSSLSSKSSQYPHPPSKVIISQTSSCVKKTKARNRAKNGGIVRARSATPPAKTKAPVKSDVGQNAEIPNKQSLNPIKPKKESRAQAAKTITYTKVDFDDLNPPSVYTPLKREDVTRGNNDIVSQSSSGRKKDRNKYRHLVGVEKNVKHLYENTGPAVKLNVSPLKEILLPSTSTSGGHPKVRESAQKTPQQTMKKIAISDIFSPPSKSHVTASSIGPEYRPYKLWHYGDQSSSPTSRQQHVPLANLLPCTHTPRSIFSNQPSAPSRPVPIFATPQAPIPSLKPILGFKTPKVRPPLNFHNSNPVFQSYPNGYVNGPTAAPPQSRHRHDSENLIQNDSIQSYGFYSPPLIKRRTPGTLPGSPQPGSGEYFLTFRSREAQTRGTMYPTYDYEDTFREMYR